MARKSDALRYFVASQGITLECGSRCIRRMIEKEISECASGRWLSGYRVGSARESLPEAP